MMHSIVGNPFHACRFRPSVVDHIIHMALSYIISHACPIMKYIFLPLRTAPTGRSHTSTHHRVHLSPYNSPSKEPSSRRISKEAFPSCNKLPPLFIQRFQHVARPLRLSPIYPYCNTLLYPPFRLRQPPRRRVRRRLRCRRGVGMSREACSAGTADCGIS